MYYILRRTNTTEFKYICFWGVTNILKKYENFIFKNSTAPLSTIPFHADVPYIERYFSEGFPLHLAIHKVSDANEFQEYTKPHSHDVHEINIIIGDENNLEYLVQLGDEVFEVRSNSSIWIPSGLQHSANVIKGSGYYIAIRLC